MANYHNIVNASSTAYAGGQQPHLPPKTPFPSVAPTFIDHGPAHGTTSRVYEPPEVQSLHQRTSSESRLIEEQPSWLDDLLNEPDTPMRKGVHRRSSSDSFAYLGSPSSFCNEDSSHQMETMYRNAPLLILPGSIGFPWPKDHDRASFYSGLNSFGAQPLNRRRESTTNVRNLVSQHPITSNAAAASLGQISAHKNGPSATAETQKINDSAPNEKKGSSEKGECSSHPTPSSSDDQKRIKQQFAQHSRVRKLQYIAELERTVQALQAEQVEVSDRQHLIVSLENKALRQRLESIAQQQLAKHLEQEMLETKVMRLRMLMHHLQRRFDQQVSNSVNRDLDLHFAAPSLSPGQGNANHG